MKDAPENLTRLSRFQALWQRCLIPGANDHSEAIHERLLSGYREPNRHYHSVKHIEHCLAMFDQCQSLAKDADSLELAVWFHDVILECGRCGNEARSAELYLELSAGVHSDAMREAVRSLIMATLHDGSSLEQVDSIYMVDIDLSSFGLPWEEFLRDSLDLRTESPQLCDEDYHLNQTGFQRSLLARPRFYLSDFFHDRFEQCARNNLARYFEYLKNPG